MIPSFPAQPGAGLGAEGILIPAALGALSPTLSWIYGSEGEGVSRAGQELLE